MGAKKSKKALNSEELIYVMKQTNLDATTINDWYEDLLVIVRLER